MTRIVELNVEAVKRITAAHINPDGSLVIIGGRNAQGKSSVLDSIAYAIGGKRLLPAEPLQRGADKGKVSVTLDDGVTITRTFTPGGGGTLKIETADGMSPKGAQGWLDARIGALSFDPTAFLREKPQDQAATLRRLCGVDTTAIDSKRKAVYDERTEIGRDGARAKGAAESALHHDDAPAEEVSIEVLMQRRREAGGQHNAHASAVRAVEEMRRNAAGCERDAEAIEAQSITALASAKAAAEETRRRAEEMIRQAEEALQRAEVEAAAEAKRAKSLRAHAAAVETEAANEDKTAAKLASALPDIDAIDAEIAGADLVNRKVRDNRDHARKVEAVEALRAQYEAKTAEIAALDAQRASMLQAAAFPVEGLGINDTGVVTYNDIPLDQASQAEQIRVSLGMGIAMSPELRIILIRDGSLLDADNLALIAELAEKADAQVWIERVGGADEGAIVIEDGQVVA